MYIRGAPVLLGITPFDDPKQRDAPILFPQQQDGHFVMPILLLATAANIVRVLALLRSAFRSGSSLRELDLQELAVATAPSQLLFAQSCLWACYGHYAGDPNIARFNAFLALTCVFFFGCAARTTRLRNILWFSALCAAAIAASLLVIAWVPFPVTGTCRVLILSFVGSIVTASLLAVSLHKTVEEIQTLSVEKFSVTATVAAFVSTGLWTGYAWTTGDAVYFRLNAAGCAVAIAEMSLWLSGVLRAVWRRDPNRKGQSCLASKEPLPMARMAPTKAPRNERHRPMMPRGPIKANVCYSDAWLVGEQQLGKALYETAAQELTTARTGCEEQRRRGGGGKQSAFGSAMGAEIARPKRSSSKLQDGPQPGASPARTQSQARSAMGDVDDTSATQAQKTYVRRPMEKHSGRRPARESKQAVRISNVTCAADCIL